MIILIALSTWLAAPWAASEDSWLTALKRRDWGAIEHLVSQGADVNQPSGRGASALMRSVERNRPGSVRVLLADRATAVNVRNEHGATALHYAVARGDVDMARSLVERGADIDAEDGDGRTPLEMANGRSHRAIVQFLEGRNRSKQRDTRGLN